MKKTLLAAIIAATALVPPAALAQDRGGRWGGGSRAESARPSNGGGSWRGPSAPQRSESRPQRQWSGGERGGWTRPSQPAPVQAQPQQQRPQAAPQPSRGQWNGQRQRGGTFYGNTPQQQRPQQWQGGRNLSDRGNRDWNRDRGNDGRDWNRDRGNDGRDWNGDRSRGSWNDGRNRGGWDNNRNRWDNDRGRSWNNGGRWNNGWRNDRRYDWRGYRNLNRGLYRLPRYYAPSGWGYGYRRFGIGFTLNSILYSSQYWINDPFYYRLPAVDGPYRWVRYYNDALLVDIYSGEVVDTIYDIFW
jgi:hypothetical protein